MDKFWKSLNILDKFNVTSIICSKSAVVYSAFFDREILKKISENSSKHSKFFANNLV